MDREINVKRNQMAYQEQNIDEQSQKKKTQPQKTKRQIYSTKCRFSEEGVSYPIPLVVYNLHICGSHM